MYTIQQLGTAVAKHDTIYFDVNLQPVTPQAGQWFVEVHFGNGWNILEGDIVEVVEECAGVVLVASEGDEDCRPMIGDVLILQACSRS